ncbi:hypothetical protein LCGC14_2747760 [marine sediment metagenome]|uniref:Uncharacterized protein n=1 Tax=marine sediment metagenome TaxID=412755 RepID=A0A0F9BBG9_9ZZZZ
MDEIKRIRKLTSLLRIGPKDTKKMLGRILRDIGHGRQTEIY